MANWQALDHGSHDVVLCAAYNLYGTRLATGSADHHIRVFDKDEEGGWRLKACWRAHDGEVADIKWSTPLLHPPQSLFSISTDATLKFWTENLTRQRLQSQQGPPQNPSAVVDPSQQPTIVNPWFPLAPTIPSRDRHTYPWVSISVKAHFASPIPSSTTGADQGNSTASPPPPRRPSATPVATTSMLTTPTILIAAITHTGNLSIFQPSDPENLSEPWADWMGGRDFYVCHRIPRRGEETSFCVAWHDERLPCWTAVTGGRRPKQYGDEGRKKSEDTVDHGRKRQGLDKGSVGLAVGCGNWGVKIFRTDAAGKLFLACEFGAPEEKSYGQDGYYDWHDNGEGDTLIRNVAWSNGSVRGWDTIATGGKDGVVRVWELHTPDQQQTRASTGDISSQNGQDTAQDSDDQKQHQTNPPSGLTASLQHQYQSYRARLNTNPILSTSTDDPTHVTQTATLVASLAGHEGAVWKVGFSVTGDMLTSTGDDGVVRFWKRSAEGPWLAWGDLDVSAGAGEDLDPEDEEIEIEVG